MASMRRVQFRSSLESATGGEGDLDELDRQEGGRKFYPLEDLLQEAVQQEKLVWEKTKGVRLSTTDDDVQSLRAVDGMSTVGGSSASMLTASTLTSPPDPNTTYLIRYGQLTDELHKFFRKLEKEHACLHLTGRRAIFENLRLHPEDTASTTSTIRQATAPVPAARQRNTHRVTEVHILKDEELLVYRCALMCAQFPMLSAPSPPGDRSPTPHLPTPLINSVSMGFTTKPSSEGLLAAAPGPVPMSSSAPHAIHIPQPRRHPLNPDSTGTPLLDKQPTSKLSQDDQDQSSVVKPKPKRTLRLPVIVRDQYTDDEEDDEELSKLSANHLSAGLSDGPLGREQPFTPMVNREMLCSLVRCSFQQTEEQQLQFEQILRHEYGRKSKGEILARELVAQQQVLENNSHPFYKPRNFVTRNGYEIWLQAEKSRIKEHLDKFWHYQLPRPLIHSTSPDYHRAYCCLLEKIICYESRSPRREPVHGGRTPSAPLSPTAQRLLTEFGLRFGVGELYRRLAYLDYLAKHFDYEAWYIHHCTDELKTIRSYIPRNRTKMSTTRQEMDILKKTVHLLHGQADNSLTRITRLFQDEEDPSLGVATLIELLRELLDAEQVLFNNKRVRTLDEWLKKYLRCGFVLRYERKKEIVSDEIFSRNNIAPFMLTPVLINALLLAIREEVNDFRDKYQPVFRRYFNVVPLAKVEFYRLLCSDACTLCARVIHNPSSRQKLNLEMMGLLYRLNDRDIEWCGVIPTEMQQWRNQFVHLALIWMEVLTKQANQWILAALTRDTWGLLSISGPSLSSSSTPSLRGCSPAGSSGLLPTAPSPFQPTLIGAAYLSQHSSAFTPVAPISRNFSPIMTETSGAVSDSSYSLTSNDSTPSELSPVKRPQLVHLRSGSMSSNSPLNFGRTGEPPLLGEVLVSHLPAPNTDYEGDSEREGGDHVITLVRSRVKSHDSDSQVNGEEDREGMGREPDRVVNGFANPSFEHSSGDDEVKKQFPPHDLAVNTPLPPSSPSHDASPLLNSSRVLPSRPPHLSVVRPSAFSPHPAEEDEELPDVPSSSIITLPSTPTASVDLEAVLLPLSSSPVDILTMFTRMASFVGMLLSVLTPKLRQGFRSNHSAQASSEMPNEVAQVREQIAEIQRQTETMRIEFLKRLHKTMMNSLKLYADNLLCMDLCCWPHGEARAILGDEMMHHLQRRKDNQEIWGCRHIVEARFGLHPDGIPCQKKTASKFENITRDMCVRVNNIHALISIFKSLESHVYSTTFSPSQRYPFAASSFGGLSSTTTTESTSLLQSIEVHTQRPNPHRYRKEQSNATNIQLLPSHESDQIGSDASIYGISPAQKRKMESGFQSGESRQLLDYLNRVQEYQLKMLSVRFNKFFRPALSLLLKLKLSKPINRRLDPIVTYLSRHKTAFRKYIYPKCFQELMIHIWIKIVQDLEEEALKLKKEKKPVTHQAHQLLQTVAHLIKVMDDEDDGLFMDKMISSTEYLLALLDMFVQSTDRLIKSFNTLNAPQLTNTHITLNSSTTPIDPSFLHSLRSKLHSVRKCFSGSEFVEAVIQIGQDKQEELTAPTSETGQPLAYNYSYATEVGQHLLNERILVCVLQHHADPVLNGLESSSTERMHAIDTTFHSSTEYQHHSPTSTSSTHSIGSIRDGEDVATSRRLFQNSHQSLYRFVDMEDRESGFVFHSMQVLIAALSNSNLPNNNQPEMRRRRGNEMSEFDQARFTTQVMIADILQQRVRNDKLAKTFLASPHVVQVLQRAELTDQQAYKLIRI